jgi:hypothetical protein
MGMTIRRRTCRSSTSFLLSSCLAVASALLAGCGEDPDPPSPDVDLTPPRPIACLESYRIKREDSVIQEMRRRGIATGDFYRQIAAGAVNRDTYVPVSATAAYGVDGQPLLWLAPAGALLVDQLHSSDLTVVDVTSMKHGETLPVGALTQGTLGKISGRDTVKFLMASRVVAVWIHVWADVCLAEESTGADGAYRLHVTGEHVYFTSGENREPLDFDVSITSSGAISVNNH